LSSKHSFDF